MGDSEDQTTFVELNRRRQQQEEENEDDLKPKQNWYERLLQSRRTKLLALVFLIALVVPLLIYYFVLVPIYRADDISHTCAISRDFRILCGDGNFTEQDCLDRECCFDFTDKYCYHFMPSKYKYLPREGFFEPAIRTDVFQNNATELLKCTIQHINENKVRIIIHNNTHDSIPSSDTASYEVREYKRHLGFDIVRRGTGDVILTTGLGPVMASENYLELSFYMGGTLFGLDELYFGSNETFRKVIYKNRDDHTTIPAFMAYNGTYAGLYLDIAGPVELSVLPSRLISVRILSNAEMSFTVVTGPTPKDVQRQLYQFDLPPRWMLQPHICRDGPTDLQSLIEEFHYFVGNNTDVQYATDCLHQNLYYLLHSLNETERQNLKTTLELLNNGSTFIMTLYPQVLKDSDLYQLASDRELLYKLGNETYHSVHLDQQVAYLDYSGDNVHDWFNETRIRLGLSELNAGGYSLKDNWPDDGAFAMERIEELPYLNGTFTRPMSKTIPWNATTLSSQRHLRIHNDYAKGQVDVVKRVFDNPLIFTSAYTTGMSDVIPQVQNMNASWVNLKRAIKMVLSHGLLAGPLISIPVCGSTSEFDHSYQYILCSRWYITAATFPIFTVSSDFPRRDHTALPSGHSRDIALNAVNVREMLTPYLYTVLSRGEPLTRPMFYDFYWDNYTHALDVQYMLGDALLVAQPLLRDMYLIVVYLPQAAGGFYEFFGGEYFEPESGNVTLSVLVETDWLVFMRAGKIVPLLNEGKTYTMAIALNLSDSQVTASGDLHFNNARLEMTADKEMLSLFNLADVRDDLGCNNGEAAVDLPSIISEARIYGLNENFMVYNLELNLCETDNDETQVPYTV